MRTQPASLGADAPGARPGAAPRAEARRTGPLARVWLPRSLHPLAWWIWAAGLAVAATKTTNPVLLATILAVAAVVVAARRGTAPWARAFGFYLLLGGSIIALRVAFRVVLGGSTAASGRVLFTLPHASLPAWMAGVSIGGPVVFQAVLAAAYDGLRLATMLCCVGAANVLADPKRLLRALPGALYEIGTAVVIALTVAPQLIESGQRVLKARRLRGETGGRFRLLHRVVLPVLQDALARSLALAAAMESRGYARQAGVPAIGWRRASGGLLVAGSVGIAVGGYGVLAPADAGAYGGPAIAAGVVLLAAGLVAGHRRALRSRYRPDPWALPEWLVAASGVLAAAAYLAPVDAAVLQPPTSPLGVPALAVLPVLGALVAVLPAIAAPPPGARAAPPPPGARAAPPPGGRASVGG